MTPEEVAANLAKHEAVCAERFTGICDRLTKIERVLGKGNIALISGLLGVIAWLVIHYILVK